MEGKLAVDRLIFVVSLIIVPLITYVAAVTLYMVWVMDKMLNPMGFYMPSIVFIITTWALMVGLLMLVMVKVRQNK